MKRIYLLLIALFSAVVFAANQEVITLDETSSQLEAPQAGDTYWMPRPVFIYDTTATSTANSALTLHRDSASPADNDYLAEQLWNGENDTSQETTYAKIGVRILDVTDATEDGLLYADTIVAGAITRSLQVSKDNVSLGTGALDSYTSGTGNIAIGWLSGTLISSGVNNTAIGNAALVTVSTQSSNTAVGSGALANTAASNNTAIGVNALNLNAAGTQNVGVGFQAGKAQAGANDNDNTWIGYNAGLAANGSASGGNTAVGSTALDALTTGIDNVAIGFNANGAITTTSGTVCLGADCVASANRAVSINGYAVADDVGEMAYASDTISAAGDAQISTYVLNIQTSDGSTNVEMFTDGTAGRISIDSDSTAYYDCQIVARRTDSDGESAGYSYRGVIDNNAGTTALVGAQQTETDIEDTAAWATQITADDTNDSLKLDVTGAVGSTINWVGRCEITKVKG